MNTIDLTPLYRNSIGFDRLATLLDSAMRSDPVAPGYPPYDIEVLGENRYAITLAVAGFERNELELVVEKGVLTVRGKRGKEENRRYLHHGIANRAFERKFNLADYVEVKGADLHNGLLTINLAREVPEAMKPRSIEIGSGDRTQALEHSGEQNSEEAA